MFNTYVILSKYAVYIYLGGNEKNISESPNLIFNYSSNVYIVNFGVAY